jgi:hypothetical protein
MQKPLPSKQLYDKPRLEVGWNANSEKRQRVTGQVRRLVDISPYSHFHYEPLLAVHKFAIAEPDLNQPYSYRPVSRSEKHADMSFLLYRRHIFRRNLYRPMRF